MRGTVPGTGARRRKGDEPGRPQGIASPQHGDQVPHTRTEILALTGVRAIAATAVVLHHIRLPKSAPDPLHKLIGAGYIGVPLFFMLSGFVLAWNYSTLTPGSGKKVWRFYVARIARVMPLYWVVLTYLVLMRAARGLDQSTALWRHYLAVQSWSGNWTVGAEEYNAPGWSICVEVFLYALFPFLVPLVVIIARRYKTAGLLALIGAAWVVQLSLVTYFTAKGYADQTAREATSAHRWLYRNPLTRLPDFITGMSLAFIVMRGLTLRARTANVLQALCVIFVIVCASSQLRFTGAFGPIDFGPPGLFRALCYAAMWTIPFGLLLLSLATSPKALLSRFLATRAMVALGTASYALYLTHRPLLPGFGQALAQSGHGITAYLAVLSILGLCLLVAEGAHRYIEVPCRRWILRLAPRRDPSPSPPRPAQAEPKSTPAGPTDPAGSSPTPVHASR
jgi:peptidoglycan/LPS O-acetylase OafA/YrhL